MAVSYWFLRYLSLDQTPRTSSSKTGHLQQTQAPDRERPRCLSQMPGAARIATISCEFSGLYTGAPTGQNGLISLTLIRALKWPVESTDFPVFPEETPFCRALRIRPICPRIRGIESRPEGDMAVFLSGWGAIGIWRAIKSVQCRHSRRNQKKG